MHPGLRGEVRRVLFQNGLSGGLPQSWGVQSGLRASTVTNLSRGGPGPSGRLPVPGVTKLSGGHGERAPRSQFLLAIRGCAYEQEDHVRTEKL